jgi:hypothetical protein
MTKIAQQYQRSRTFLSRLLLMANVPLETLLSDEKLLGHHDQRHFAPLLFLLRLAGNGSLLSMAAILQALDYHPHSVGFLSQCFHKAGQALPSTLVMPSKTWVFYLSDEIFALDKPILITIAAHSTTILNIALATERSAETWRAHCAALEQHHFLSLGRASDRGTGLVAGYQAACDMALWVADYFHEVRDLYEVLHQWERTAYAAIDKEYEAARTFANAKSEAHLQKRLAHYDPAHRTCEQAMALYDHCALLLHWRREALHGCSPQGRRRTQAQVRSALLLLFDRMAALDSAAMRKTLQSRRLHLDDLLSPFKHAEALAAALRAIVPHEAFDFLVLAWHHDHFVHQAGAQPKGYHQRERACWLACAAGLLGDAFDTLNALVVDKLDSSIRASSLVEMVNGLMRPYLNSCKGQITQETLNLSMFYHNHRCSKSGKRQGQAPMELWTGEP